MVSGKHQTAVYYRDISVQLIHRSLQTNLKILDG
jgi:hypothetical protein